MCNPIAGTSTTPPSMPGPVTPGPPQVGPVPGGAPVPADVAGAVGGGHAMPTNLSHALQQLVDAVALLTKAMGSMTGGAAGGGPMQSPMQAPPGKGDPIQGGGDIALPPTERLAALVESELKRTDLSTTQRNALTQIRDNDLKKALADAALTGAFNPMDIAQIDLKIERARMADNDPRIAKLDALLVRLGKVKADADRTGAFDPVALQEIAYERNQIIGLA